MAATAEFWATRRQLEQLRRLVDEIGEHDAARVLVRFGGTGSLESLGRFLTHREAASLIILLTVVASSQPLVA